jgi:hypothetical protein
MTETPRNAIDTALIKLNLASQYLEITRPSKTDVKKAGEASKDASDILKACLVLLDHDCYSVQDPPQGAPTPLFKPDGQPQAAADVTAKDGAEADLSRPALGCIDVEIITERKFKVGDRVKYLWLDEPEIGIVTEDNGDPEEERPYLVHAENDPEGGPLHLSASDMEAVAADYVLPAAPIEAEPFPGGNKAAQKKVFEERLTTLEEIFCERLDLAGSTEPYGNQLKQFRPHRDAWIAAWKTDPKQAWTELLKAIAVANVTATEFTAWAPAA